MQNKIYYKQIMYMIGLFSMWVVEQLFNTHGGAALEFRRGEKLRCFGSWVVKSLGRMYLMNNLTPASGKSQLTTRCFNVDLIDGH